MPIKFDDIEDTAIRAVLENPDVQSKIQSRIDSSVSALTAKNQELLTEVKTIKSSLSELGGLDAIKALVSESASQKAAREQAELEQARANGNVKDIETRYATQLQEKDQELSGLKTSIVEKEVKNVLTSAIVGAKGSDLLEPFMRSRVKGQFGTSGIEIEVLNDDGTPMLTSKGTKATVADLVEEFKGKEKYQTLFSGSGKSGSGSDHSVNVDDTKNPFDKKSPDFNLTEAMKFYKENPDKARKMAAKVGFKIG